MHQGRPPTHAHFVDIVGTGVTPRIPSTSPRVAFVAAGRVDRGQARRPSVSSKSGSADVLEALGVNINLQPPQVLNWYTSDRHGFYFAPITTG